MKIVIAGGGTGGHLYPGLAIAEEFQRRNNNISITFVGTKDGIESWVLPEEGYPLLLITSSGMKGKSLFRKAKALASIPLGLFQSLMILLRLKPDMVVGVGGYVSGPLMLSAVFLGLPTLIHEQNFYPGLTNRILSRLVGRIAISFPDSIRFFPKKKVVFTGNPIRRKFLEGYASNDLPKRDEKFTLLIFGGSQGSHRINMTALEMLSHLDSIKEEVFIIHQTGFHDLEIVEKGYKDMGFAAFIRPFIFNMHECYSRANLVLCRAGASSIAEITALGKAAILVPYPHAANNHQVFNANYMKKAGAALAIEEGDLTPELLANRIKEIFTNPNRLHQMEEKSLALGMSDSSLKIVELGISEMTKLKPKTSPFFK